jgi:hypothetical protein
MKKKRSTKQYDTAKPKHVVQCFNIFSSAYQNFRYYNGLNKKIKNVHEILTGMTDKHGRICRHIKHQERKDPKDNWKSEITSSFTGYIVYALMLMEHYGIDIGEGMEKELNEAIKQHGR